MSTSLAWIFLENASLFLFSLLAALYELRYTEKGSLAFSILPCAAIAVCGPFVFNLSGSLIKDALYLFLLLLPIPLGANLGKRFAQTSFHPVRTALFGVILGGAANRVIFMILLGPSTSQIIFSLLYLAGLAGTAALALKLYPEKFPAITG